MQVQAALTREVLLVFQLAAPLQDCEHRLSAAACL